LYGIAQHVFFCIEVQASGSEATSVIFAGVHLMRNLLLFAVIAMSSTSSFPAQAQDASASMNDISNGMASKDMMDGLKRSQVLVFDGPPESYFTSPNTAGNAGPVQFTPDPSINTAAKLAAVYPAAYRQQAEGVFQEMLALYGRVEGQYNIPKNDLAGAAAVFILMSHNAYSGGDQPAEMIAPLAAQLRTAMASNPSILRLSNRDKQDMFEQFAIIGMFVEGTRFALQGRPNPKISASLQKAGNDYLRTFLNTDPAKIKFSNKGMVIEGAKSQALTPTLAANNPGNNPAVKQGTGGEAASNAAQTSDGIQTVGFDTKTGMGYGGMLTFNPEPVVLFRNGDALRDAEGLNFAGGLAAHKSANPDDWTKWRRSGAAIEIMKSDGWKKITYTKTMDRLPKGFLLQGSYRSSSGTGSLATGGGDAVIAWSNMSFDAQGGFLSGRGAGASSFSAAGSVVTSGQAPNEHGRYSINGYTLMLNYADGRTERRMIVTDPANTKAIWLDGTGYTKRK
jgi:hypothetical protein